MSEGASRPEAKKRTAQARPRKQRIAFRPEGGRREARRIAAAILEVLAGARTPADAASALGVSSTRYYALETQALHGLLMACEPRPRGPAASPAREIESLRRRVRQLEGELRRQQALARAAGRAAGLKAPEPPKSPEGKKRRKRRPTARALTMASRLESEAPPAAAGAAGEGADTAKP